MYTHYYIMLFIRNGIRRIITTSSSSLTSTTSSRTIIQRSFVVAVIPKTTTTSTTSRTTTTMMMMMMMRRMIPYHHTKKNSMKLLQRSSSCRVLSSSSSSSAASSGSTTSTTSTPSTSTSTSSTSLHYNRIEKNNFGINQEYSVIHTDRSLNLMSQPFQTIMNDLYNCMNTTYNSQHTIIIPGSGTFGMESVARQFAYNQHSMVLRNGWFSYRWTEILDMMKGCNSQSQGNNSNSNSCTNTNCTNTTTHTVLSAEPIDSTDIVQPQYQPMNINKVLETIEKERPKVFFCPHVETSTGIIVPDSYIQQIATKMHSINGIFVLDCIASGCIWVDMKLLNIDVVISAPQKGWSGPPCVALVMLSQRALDIMNDTNQNNQHIETSFSLSLKRWSTIMDAYNKGGFAYHTTMPTDSLRDFHSVTVEILNIGLSKLKQQQLLLGNEIRHLLTNQYELKSVAADHYDAPGVLVYYSPGMNCIDNPIMMSTFRDVEQIQIAMGVPWKLQYEPIGLKTFRIGLFGIDKLMNIEHVKNTLNTSLYNVLQHLHTTYNIELPNSMKK